MCSFLQKPEKVGGDGPGVAYTTTLPDIFCLFIYIYIYIYIPSYITLLKMSRHQSNIMKIIISNNNNSWFES